jgi:hypothetical protein
MKKKVFGVDLVVDQIAKAIVVAENQRHINPDSPQSKGAIARRFGFFGVSSTGKTETAKVLAEELYGDRSAIVTFNHKNIQTEHAFQTYFTGVPGSNKPSKFMQEFDRRNGRLIFVLDEMAETPRDILMGLYDFLREPEVTNFNDGETRKMGGVTFILTGNSGQQWYQGIPAEVPELERMASMLEIYKRAMKNTRAQELLLLEYFSEALLSRIGMENITFFPPLDFKAIRQMFQLKFSMAIDDLKPGAGKEGWKVVFPDRNEYNRILDAFEYEGFRVSSQGASIGRFVKEDFTTEMDYALQKAGVPSGTRVQLTLNEEKTYDQNAEFKGVYLNVQPEGQSSSIPVYIKGKTREYRAETSPQDQALVAYHEAGHDLVRHVFLGDAKKSMGISVIPGVDWISGRWIYYLGVARSERLRYLSSNREVVLRDMAILFGGTVAQELVTQGARHDAGKSNDLERATSLARMAIFYWGLAPHVTQEVVGHNVDLENYIQNLDPETFAAYRKELAKMLSEARLLARSALLVNYDQLVELGKTLAEKGELTKEDLERFYEEHKIIPEGDPRFAKLAVAAMDDALERDEQGRPQLTTSRWDLKRTLAKARHWWNKRQKSNTKIDPNGLVATSRDAELLHPSLMPKSVANIHAIVKEAQRKGRESAPELPIPLMTDEPFLDSIPARAGTSLMACSQIFAI